MADIVRRIPDQLSHFGSEGTSSYSLKDYKFDYAVGGIPFLSATRDAWPYTEGMAEIRKQQFDSFAEPGEQSLYGWWLRSQSTFNAGAGLLYQDPDNDNQFNYRFADSLGVDPWTSGQVSLLRTTNIKQALISATSKVVGYVRANGTDAGYLADGGLFYNLDSASITAITNPSAGSLLDLAAAGNRSLIQMTDGVYTNVEGGAVTQMFSYPGAVTTGCIGYVKGRVVTATDRTIYVNAINTGASVPITTGPPAAQYTFQHPDPMWRWTSVTEGPTAFYVAGTNGTQSTIYKFTSEFSGATETFIPTVSAVMPSGELINTIYGYIGSFVGIATTKGFRVGELDSNGDVVYGPLLFTPTGGCKGIIGFDRFMWTGSTNQHDGATGTFRIDLGNTIQEQTTRAVRYAYARDAYGATLTGAVTSVAFLGASNRLMFTIQSSNLMLQAATTLVSSGYLRTGRIRFNTEEPKLYKFVSIRTPNPLLGNVQFSVISEDGVETPYTTYGPTFPPNTGDVATPTPAGQQNWIILKFTLSRGTDTATGGVLNGWQVKALPGSIRQRLINQTFLLFDEEMDKGGQRVGWDNYARERFEEFKALARAGDVIVFQELVENISTLVVIDDWKFSQLAPPGPNASTLGGYLTVVLRTVAEGM